jgi:broad specificity phosphatase PhoE
MRFYDRFLRHRQQIYCSPLLRALQTAHLALPEEDDGWGSIKLLKDARERFSLRIERDCLGAEVGSHIIDRAMQMSQELSGLEHRVDATDCDQKWWSDEPESEADIGARLKNLWRKLLAEDNSDSCVLVTHSNLIKALLMYFGEVDANEMEQKPESEGEFVTETAGIPLGSRRRLDDSPLDLERGESDASGDSDLEERDMMETTSWQVVARSSETLRRFKIDRLQNCGVLGLRCVVESPTQKPHPEVDGWIHLDEHSTEPYVAKPRWVARDALLMFDSVLVQ